MAEICRRIFLYMAEICCMESSSYEAATAGTSCVSGSVVPPRNYDVFLNHRGPDVKKSFADHLTASLESVGVTVFIDHKDLHVGECTWDAIESAIRRSKIHIAIFSPDYASSPWCLKELQEMLACRTNGSSELFLPVFFQVDPSDLRYSSSPKSCYSKAFAKHLKRYGQEVIANWRSALKEASDVTGFPRDTAQGFEARLVKRIVSEVLDVLSRTPLDIASHPVGVKEKLQEVLAIDKAQQGLHILGIYGMGGVGKTTLAKSIYNEIYRDFDGACYIESVRSTNLKGLEAIQERMLRDLLKTNEGIDVPNISRGKRVMKDRLSGLKILIILDDIDDREQVKALIEPFETINLKEGSQLVVTTRDEQIVIWAKAQQFPMDGLSKAHAHTLFNWHAFGNPEGPPNELITLAKKVVDACQGLPLALETLGAHLFKKNIDEWKDTVKVLEGRDRHNLPAAKKEVMPILRVSYDRLSNEERVMFLDIACFMLGEREDRAKRILFCESDAAKLCFETLRLKSLVKVDRNRRLTMHDLLRDMGRQIVECSHDDVWRRSHLWDETGVREVLRQRKGASEVRGVSLTPKNQEKWSEEEWSVESFAGMDSLKFLLLGRWSGWCKIIGDFGLFPTKLTWFQWMSCPLESLPPKMDLSKVAVLDLSNSDIASLSNGHTFENLRELCLHSSRIHELPDLFNSASCKKLEVLDLSRCSFLESVPESIGCLSSTLTHLDLSSCTNLTTLPDALGRLHCLKSLKLDTCFNLTRLPDAFGQLTALEDVGLDNLHALELLPQSLGNLTKLSSLELLSPLKELPCTIGNLRKLSSLIVVGSSIVRLPEEIGKLSKLVTLDLVGNRSLSHLPRSIGQLKELVKLRIKDCSIGEGGLLEDISNLSSLEHLDLSLNPFSKLSVHLQRLSELRILHLMDCKNLREIPPLPPSLEELHISCCYQLTRLPSNMSCLSQLEKFTAGECRGLRNENLSQLASLTSLSKLELPVSHLGPWMEKLVSLEFVGLDGEHWPHCFNEYKQEVQVFCLEEQETDEEQEVQETDEEQEVSWQRFFGEVLVRVPRTGDGKECKGLVICIAAWPDFPFRVDIKICGQLVHVATSFKSCQPVHVMIYRAAKHPFVADLKGGATIELLITVPDLMAEPKGLPEVAVRLVYEDHEFEEINWAARM